MRLPPLLFYEHLNIIVMQKYCISVDWLQVYCKGARVAQLGEEAVVGERFSLKKRDMETALWKSVYEVREQDLVVAIICANPRSSVMEQYGCTLKLENRVLYSTQYIQLLYDIMRACTMTYVGVSRIDLCYDCNMLKDGLSVPAFLNSYVTAAPFQHGHIIRSGSRKFSMNATRSTTGVMEINSLRWGSQASDIGAYCYNKSLEMLEVKEKPWIVDVWEKNGIEHEIDDSSWKSMSEKKRKFAVENGNSRELVRKSVWRFEISIKSHGKDILNLDTGELFKLSTEYLESQANIEKLFFIYAAKVFDFRKSEGQKNVRDYPKMCIFENDKKVSARPYKVSVFLDSGRSEKMCYNKIVKLSEQYTDLSDAQQASLQATLDFILSVSGKKMSVVRLKRQEAYLRNMRASRFIGEDDFLYLGSLEAARLAKYDIDPLSHYSFIRSLIDSVNVELLRDEGYAQEEGYPYGL